MHVATKLATVLQSKKRYAILAGMAIFIGTLGLVVSIMQNLNAIEQNRINEYQTMAINLGEMVKDFLVKEQYGDLQNLLFMLTKTSNLKYMAVYIGDEVALQAGDQRSLDLRPIGVQNTAKDSLRIQKRKSNLHLEKSLQDAERLKKERHLQMVYSLQEFDSRRKLIMKVAVAIEALLGILLLVYYRLDRTREKLQKTNLSLGLAQAKLEKTNQSLQQSNLSLEEAKLNLENTNISLREAKEKLLEEEKNRTNMIDAISHDALHYVTVINGNISNQLAALEKRIQIMDAEKSYRILLESNSSLGKLLENLKYHDFLMRDIVKNGPEIFEWCEFVTQTLDGFKYLFAQKQVKVKITHPPAPVSVNVDKELAKRIIVNLVHNAFKFTREKGMVKIQISCAKRIVKTVIADQGPGIPRKDWERIFEPSVRLENNQYVRPEDKRGTGLGLSNARQFVELYAGKMAVQKSILGKGTAFYFTLPQSRQDTN